MSSRILAASLAAGCLTAAVGGAYVAVRHDAAPPVSSAPAAPGTVPAASAPAAGTPSPGPVSETEAIVDAPAPVPERPVAAEPAPEPRRVPPADGRRARPVRPEPARTKAATVRAAVPAPVADAAQPSVRPPAAPPERVPSSPIAERGSDAEVSAAAASGDPAPARSSDPRPPVRQYEELVVPASSVLGLRVDTPLSSERSRLEDRVDARVSRDVTIDGRVAIPSGSRVLGSVTLVERGGKMRERARLGVRFHTLVLADGREVALRTETIMREGDSPSSESARKIGGAAIGGAILGAIMGGGKGAILGGATGAAGGGAVVMTGDRNAATLPAGTVVSVRLSSPAPIEVEHPRQQQ